MRRSRKPITIASRRSELARVQAEMVGHALARLHRNLTVNYLWLESEGDRETQRSLADAGGKGLFTRTLEQALLSGQADLAVHSLKDMPAQDTPGLSIAAVPTRAPVNDCLISHNHATALDDLPARSIVGTCSPRRAAQLLRLRQDLQIRPIRGNVGTRLQKVLDQPRQYDATLLAVAGLQRLGKAQLAANPLPLEQMLPAACQGALGLQCRFDDHITLTRCLPLNDPAAAAAVHAERWIVAALKADCHSSLAVLAQPIAPDPEAPAKTVGTCFRLRVRVLSPDGKACLTADERAPAKNLFQLARQIADDLTRRGAVQLLHQVEPQSPEHNRQPDPTDLHAQP